MACLSGRCLCSLNINKYSNKPAKVDERIIQRIFEDLATSIKKHFRHVGLDEYPYSHYPTHCQGLFYLMDIHVTSKLINLFHKSYQSRGKGLQ